MAPIVPRVLALASLVALPLAACSDDDGGSGGSGSGSAPASGEADVSVEALDVLEFGEGSYSAPAGAIKIEYVNGGSILHTLVVEGHEDAMRLEVSGSGDVDAGTIELDADEYVLYCDVAGHRAGGMEATFTVG